MCKEEFLARLEARLSSLPRADREERLNFYSEMIDDRMEEGLSEAEAVAAVDTAEEFTADLSVPKQKRGWKVWAVVLLVLGAPLWLSLLIAAAAVAVSVFISVWAVVISLWAVFGALAGSALGVLAGGAMLACCGHGLTGTAMAGLGLVCAGLSIFAFFGCRAVSRGMWMLTKMPFAKIRKGAAK